MIREQPKRASTLARPRNNKVVPIVGAALRQAVVRRNGQPVHKEPDDDVYATAS